VELKLTLTLKLNLRNLCDRGKRRVSNIDAAFFSFERKNNEYFRFVGPISFGTLSKFDVFLWLHIHVDNFLVISKNPCIVFCDDGPSLLVQSCLGRQSKELQNT